VQKTLRFFYGVDALLGFGYAVFHQAVFAVLGSEAVDAGDHGDDLVFTFEESAEVLSI